MKKKSVGVNAALNGLKNIMSVFFPLITFPYVSRVLQVDNLGKYNFSSSIIDYFILLAALGINTYSIREGARIREDKNKISQFSSEIFSINIVSMLLSYLLLIIVVIVVPKLHSYLILIAILSLEILFRTIGTEWLYSIYEEYAYITIRSIVFQILSLILMFTFVRDTGDLYIYAIIVVIANAGNNLVNFIHAKKLCKFKFKWSFELKKHIKPILMIFSISIATTIYVSSDTTLLGFFTSDYKVGIYSVSVKIYKLIKTCLSSVLVVAIPRLSHYLGQREYEKYNHTFNRTFQALITIVFPAVVGLFCMSRQIVILIAGDSFVEATLSLRLLVIALIPCLFGWIYNSCVMIPQKMEKQLLYITSLSALINIVFNLILIPIWEENAAAVTTIMAETVAMFMCIYYSRGKVHLENFTKIAFSTVFGCIGIVAVCIGFNTISFGVFLDVLIPVTCSIVTYAIIIFLLKNPIAMMAIQTILQKIKRNSKNRKENI